MLNWTVIGGGNGGQALAGHLGLLGIPVRLYSTDSNKVAVINRHGYIKLTGALSGEGGVQIATTDIGEALYGADVIVIVLPSTYHEEVERAIIPLLHGGQTVMVLPEASCGALSFRALLSETGGLNRDVVIGAGATLPYTCRSTVYGEVNVISVKDEVKIAALPAKDNDKLASIFSTVFPPLRICRSVLETSLDNINAFVHPAPVLLNTSRIEAVPSQSYEYYREGITPSVARVLEMMDLERIEIAKAFGYEQRTLKTEFIEMYHSGDESNSLIELIHNNHGYIGIKNVKSMRERYTMEDIPFSLVSLQSLGRIAGVETRLIDALIEIGRAVVGDDLPEGRTIDTMGLGGLSKEEFLRVIEG